MNFLPVAFMQFKKSTVLHDDWLQLKFSVSNLNKPLLCVNQLNDCIQSDCDVYSSILLVISMEYVPLRSLQASSLT